MVWLYHGLLYIWMLILIEAIPWPLIFGQKGHVDEHEGRVPVMDDFLRQNAAMLANPEDHSTLVQQAISLAKEYSMDPESAKYYVDVLMKIQQSGLLVLNRETDMVNKQMAKVLSTSLPRERMLHIMKRRHILDAFMDAAADVAWPWIRGHAKPIPNDEL